MDHEFHIDEFGRVPEWENDPERNPAVQSGLEFVPYPHWPALEGYDFSGDAAYRYMCSQMNWLEIEFARGMVLESNPRKVCEKIFPNTTTDKRRPWRRKLEKSHVVEVMTRHLISLNRRWSQERVSMTKKEWQERLIGCAASMEPGRGQLDAFLMVGKALGWHEAAPKPRSTTDKQPETPDETAKRVMREMGLGN